MATISSSSPPPAPAWKSCKGCRVNKLPAYITFSNCTDCRARNALKKREQKRRQLQILLARAEALKGTTDGDGGGDNDSKENASNSASAVLSSAPIANKSFGVIINGSAQGTEKVAALVKPKLLRDLDGKEKKAALKQMMTTLKKRVKTSGTRSSSIQTNIDTVRFFFLQHPPLQALN